MAAGGTDLLDNRKNWDTQLRVSATVGETPEVKLAVM